MSSSITPEQLADAVFQKLKSEHSEDIFPIDPFKLLQNSGVLISSSTFKNLEGIILNDSDDITVVSINSQRPWTRQRFSAAHEYCHFIKDLKKGKNDIDRIECLVGANDPIEKYADQFASALLMPLSALNKLCHKYKNSHGFVDFDSIIYISEFFGVSFESCVFRIAYKLNMIEGDISPKVLKKRIKAYHPAQKRQELILNNNDSLLIGNLIDSLSYCMVNLNSNIGAKFLNNYIYYDNRLEGINQADTAYILADLNFNKQNSQFLKSNDESTIMTLGNYIMQEYVLTTSDRLKITNCSQLHQLLYKYAPFPEYAGCYRSSNAMISRGTIQPVDYQEIPTKISELSDELDFFLKDISHYTPSEYIERVVYFIYKFIKIHPFSDGNGRVSRALLNWLLRLKNIPPIYINDECKNEYLNALSAIDISENYMPLILLVEKRVINTLMELHNYLFLGEEDKNVA